MEVSSYKELRERYEESGMVGKLGFGDKPAVIVIDFIKAFTDEGSNLGMNLVKGDVGSKTI